jgi:hypothetical protein
VHQLVRFEVFTAVTMKNGVFSDVTPCGSCKNRRFGGTSVLTRATRRNIPEETILRASTCMYGHLNVVTHLCTRSTLLRHRRVFPLIGLVAPKKLRRHYGTGFANCLLRSAHTPDRPDRPDSLSSFGAVPGGHQPLMM